MKNQSPEVTLLPSARGITLGKASDSFAARLGLPPSDRIPSDQLDIVRSGGRVAMLCHIFNTTIAASVLYDSAPMVSVLVWTLASLAVAWIVLRRPESTKPRTRLYIPAHIVRRSVFFSIIPALPWAFLSILFFEPSHQASTLMIVMLIAGMTAGGAILLAPVYPAALAYIATALTPAVIVFAMRASVYGLELLVLLSLSYGVFLVLLVAAVARLSISKTETSRKLEGALAEIRTATVRINSALKCGGQLTAIDGIHSTAPHIIAGGAPITELGSELASDSDIVATLHHSARRLIDQEDALRTSEARLSSLFNSAMDGIVSIDEDDLILSINPAAVVMFDRAGNNDLGRPVIELLDTESAERLRAILLSMRSGAAAAESGVSLVEMNGLKADGIRFPVEVSIASATNDGRQSTTLIVRDITRRKYSEAQLAMLMREVNHRSRNLLSVLASISAITAARATSHGEFNSKFSERLQCLARSHEIVMQDEWAASSLVSLIEAQSEPFKVSEHDLFRLDGPDIYLKPRAVQNLGLAFHELATNAAKYGALSVPDGYVDLKWRVVTARNKAPKLCIVWREVGGPPVARAEHRGFGSLLLDRVVGAELNGRSRRKFVKGGLVWQAVVCESYFSLVPVADGSLTNEQFRLTA